MPRAARLVLRAPVIVTRTVAVFVVELLVVVVILLVASRAK